MATKLDNDLAKNISNYGYNGVGSLYIYHSAGFSSVMSGTFSANQVITIPDESGTMVLTSGSQTIQNKMFHSQHGSATDPSYSFQGDTDTGMYRDGNNTIGFATAGVARLGISDVDIVSLLPIECDNFRAINVGAAGNTVYGNSNSTAGMYFDINRVNFSTNSVARLAIQDTSITCNQNLIVPSGTSSSCGLQFSGAAGTGMHNTSGFLYLTLGGTNMIRCQSAQIFSDVVHNFTSGSAGTPAIRGNSGATQTTGLYWTTTPTLNVAVSGTQAVGFETGGLKLYGSTAGNNALYSAALLSYYEETGAITMTFSFGTNTQAGNIYITRIGRNVTCQLAGDVSRTPSTTITSITTDTAIPLRFRPVIARIVKTVLVGDGAADAMWYCTINGNGSLTFQKLTAGTSLGHAVYSFALSWSIV